MTTKKNIPTLSLKGKTFTDVRIELLFSKQTKSLWTPNGKMSTDSVECEDWQIVWFDECVSCNQEEYDLLASFVRDNLRGWMDEEASKML
jgi:hypothetical protein